MNAPKWIAPLFILAAIYDGLLGLIFLFAPHVPYALFVVPPPNHWGYVQFPAALLVIFAIMFVQIAMNPIASRQLIVYGILLKLAYCGVATWHWINDGIPAMWQPLVFADLVFLALFGFALTAVAKASPAPTNADD